MTANLFTSQFVQGTTVTGDLIIAIKPKVTKFLIYAKFACNLPCFYFCYSIQLYIAVL